MRKLVLLLTFAASRLDAQVAPSGQSPLQRTDLPVLRPETPVIEAILQFYRNRSTLAVVDPQSRKLLGVLSYWDALAAIARPDGRPRS